MIGETVTVMRPTDTVDRLGNTVHSWAVGETVENCLVHTVTPIDLTNEKRPDGVDIQYTIAFPKTFAGDSLKGCKIALTSRGMKTADALLVVGAPDVESPCPTAWNMLVTVGRSEG